MCICSIYWKDNTLLFIVRIKIIHIGIAKQSKKIKIVYMEMKIHLVQNESKNFDSLAVERKKHKYAKKGKEILYILLLLLLLLLFLLLCLYMDQVF